MRLALLLTLALALGACANPQLRGAGLDGVGAAGAGLGGTIDDPSSAAFFAGRVGDRVLFAVDQSTLSDAARGTLQAQAAWLTANPQFDAVIEGHADEQGTREYNLALGARRAAAAQEVLIASGVAPGRLRTVTFGKERPVEICSTEACYAQNRRAVTVLATGAGV